MVIVFALTFFERWGEKGSAEVQISSAGLQRLSEIVGELHPKNREQWERLDREVEGKRSKVVSGLRGQLRSMRKLPEEGPADVRSAIESRIWTLTEAPKLPRFTRRCEQVASIRLVETIMVHGTRRRDGRPVSRNAASAAAFEILDSLRHFGVCAVSDANAFAKNLSRTQPRAWEKLLSRLPLKPEDFDPTIRTNADGSIEIVHRRKKRGGKP